MIDRMVDRFLGWKLPKTFAPDAGVKFTPSNGMTRDEAFDKPGWWPIGTNLLTADEAREMLTHAAVPIADHLFIEARGDGKWLVCVEKVHDTEEEARGACKAWIASASGVEGNRPSRERYGEMIAASEGLDGNLPCGALVPEGSKTLTQAIEEHLDSTVPVGVTGPDSTAVDGRGDASTLQEQMERDAFEKAFLAIMGDNAVWIERADDEEQGDRATYCELWTRRAWLLWRRARASTPVGSQAAQDVLAERKRQIEEEGWDVAHDDEHADNSMAHAAACYAAHDAMATQGRKAQVDVAIRGECPTWREKTIRVPMCWPSSWHSDWWKPKDRRSDLIRAGALILAEIERLDRAAPSATPESPT
jgi:hypothetical protein